MSLDDGWMKGAACNGADVNIFYPGTDRGKRANYTRALGYCKNCPVKVSCLTFAVYHSIPYGVWGGTPWEVRRKLPAATKERMRRLWAKKYPNTKPRRFYIPRGRRVS